VRSLDELTAAEREAWVELYAAERALELAQMRLSMLADRRKPRPHLRLVVSREEPCDGRR
jgi:hypothetical protein